MLFRLSLRCWRSLHSSRNTTVYITLSKKFSTSRVCMNGNPGALSVTSSSALSSSSLDPSSFIPPPPPPLPVFDGEATLSSLDLCNISPAGFIQKCLELLHINVDLPWWASIAILTVVLRFSMFPFVIENQRTTAHLSMYFPKSAELQHKITVARQSGDFVELLRLEKKFMKFLESYSDIGKLSGRSFVCTGMQVAMFLTMFRGLRAMANVPVPSLIDGGILWFTDLTAHDPYFILPCIISGTLFTMLRSGATLTTTPYQRILYLVPVAIFPIISFMPAALQIYWTVANWVSLGMILVIAQPRVSKYLNFPDIETVASSKVPSKSFLVGLFESIQNATALGQLSREKMIQRWIDEETEKPKAQKEHIEKYRKSIEELRQLRLQSSDTRATDYLSEKDEEVDSLEENEDSDNISKHSSESRDTIKHSTEPGDDLRVASKTRDSDNDYVSGLKSYRQFQNKKG